MPKRKRAHPSQHPLPEQFLDPDVEPLKANIKGVSKPLWARKTATATRLAVLRHLATYSDAPNAERRQLKKREATFLSAPDCPDDQCFTLREGPGIVLRKAPGGAYSWVWVGDKVQEVTETGIRNRKVTVRSTVPVGIDAHRLVCWLVHDAPEEPNVYVLHTCNNKRCVRPGHLQWGTQSENVSSASDRRSDERSARRGACLVFFLEVNPREY